MRIQVARLNVPAATILCCTHARAYTYKHSAINYRNETISGDAVTALPPATTKCERRRSTGNHRQVLYAFTRRFRSSCRATMKRIYTHTHIARTFGGLCFRCKSRSRNERARQRQIAQYKVRPVRCRAELAFSTDVSDYERAHHYHIVNANDKCECAKTPDSAPQPQTTTTTTTTKTHIIACRMASVVAVV